MSDLKIDEKHIKHLDGAIEHLIEHLEEERELMADEDEDIFCRYMAYHRLVSFMSGYKHLMDVTSTSFRLGNDLQNEIFHTKEHKKKGWQNPTSEGNPFFVANEEDHEEEDKHAKCRHKIIKGVIDGDELPDEIKEAFARLMTLTIKKSKKSS